MTTRILYLGNLSEALETLSGTSGVVLAAWIHEEESPELRGFCVQRGIPMRQVRTAEELHRVCAAEQFDLGVICNFGIILRPQTIALAPKGFVNVHLGILPDYPGRTPVRDAVSANEKVAGITLHRVTEQVDAGPILAKKTVSVGEGRKDELFERLARLVPGILNENLPQILRPPASASG